MVRFHQHGENYFHHGENYFHQGENYFHQGENTKIGMGRVQIERENDNKADMALGQDSPMTHG
jgi:hypothetical protein